MSQSVWFSASQLAGLPGMPGDRRNVRIVAEREKWFSRPRTGKGGGNEYHVSALPEETRNALLNSDPSTDPSTELGSNWDQLGSSELGSELGSQLGSELGSNLDRKIPKLTPPAPRKSKSSPSPSTASPAPARVPSSLPAPVLASFAATQAKRDESALFSVPPQVLSNEKARQRILICQEASNVPSGWKRQRWIKAVAVKHGVHWTTVYGWLEKTAKTGVASLVHRGTDAPRAWDAAAQEWWIGLCLKRGNRKLTMLAMYDALQAKALEMGWKIGCYRSACQIFEKFTQSNKPLVAYRDGGLRALDNCLTPVYRDYSDLQPFEIIVGDQHRFDCWVIDENTGKVFRPEGYLWQDLHTRVLYGAAVDRRYDSHLMGLALRIGCRMFGAFGTIYTDNGRPELSHYISRIAEDLRLAGMSVSEESDAEANPDAAEDTELVSCRASLPGRKLAIVKNAKAKMIEGTFDVLEGILRNQMGVPGTVKRLSDSSEAQDIDTAEIESLAAAGKLLTFAEFVTRMYGAIDYYNARHHRGVESEWPGPRPAVCAPLGLLSKRFDAGWRPRVVDDGLMALIFLPRTERTVTKGTVRLNGEMYTMPSLAGYNGETVTVRFDPCNPTQVLLWHGNTALGVASAIEYSSMKDADLASRKIGEKRTTRAAAIDEYLRLTSTPPDLRKFSQVRQPMRALPAATIQAAIPAHVETPFDHEALEAEIAARVAALPALAPKKLAVRPLFDFPEERGEWLWEERNLRGGELDAGEEAFLTEWEAALTPEEKWGLDWKLENTHRHAAGSR